MTATILDQLKTLPKLTKLNLSWYFSPPFPALDLLTEFARITGSVPLSLEWSLPEDIRSALVVAQATSCGIGITSQPYQGMGDCSARPAERKILPANDWGDKFKSDLQNFRDRLKAFDSVKDLVTHVTFDVEHWHVATECPQSLAGKYQALIDLAGVALPRAQAIWYGKGEVTINGGDPTGWKATDYIPEAFTGLDSCSLYFSEHAVNQEIFRRSGGQGGLSVAFVGLGGCQRRVGSSWARYAAPGQCAENLWVLGLELNNPHVTNVDRFPLSKAPLVYLYHQVATEAWLPEFVTYVSGAANQALAKAA